SWVSLGTDTGAPFTASWPVGADGNRALRAVATDLAGNTGSDVVDAAIDRTAPAGGSIAYADGYAAGPVAITTSDGSDAGSGLDPAGSRVERDRAPLADGVCAESPGA